MAESKQNFPQVSILDRVSAEFNHSENSDSQISVKNTVLSEKSLSKQSLKSNYRFLFPFNSFDTQNRKGQSFKTLLSSQKTLVYGLLAILAIILVVLSCSTRSPKPSTFSEQFSTKETISDGPRILADEPTIDKKTLDCDTSDVPKCGECKQFERTITHDSILRRYEAVYKCLQCSSSHEPVEGFKVEEEEFSASTPPNFDTKIDLENACTEKPEKEGKSKFKPWIIGLLVVAGILGAILIIYRACFRKNKEKQQKSLDKTRAMGLSADAPPTINSYEPNNAVSPRPLDPEKLEEKRRAENRINAMVAEGKLEGDLALPEGFGQESQVEYPQLPPGFEQTNQMANPELPPGFHQTAQEQNLGLPPGFTQS